MKQLLNLNSSWLVRIHFILLAILSFQIGLATTFHCEKLSKPIHVVKYPGLETVGPFAEQHTADAIYLGVPGADPRILEASLDDPLALLAGEIGTATGVNEGVIIASMFLFNPKVAAKGSSQLARYSGILRDAAKFKGNFGLGRGTASEALELGKAWVGKGYRVSGNGKAWISSDGLRQFKPPTYKPRLGIDQANFQWRNVNRGGWQGNGHLDIFK